MKEREFEKSSKKENKKCGKLIDVCVVHLFVKGGNSNSTKVELVKQTKGGDVVIFFFLKVKFFLISNVCCEIYILCVENISRTAAISDQHKFWIYFRQHEPKKKTC